MKPVVGRLITCRDENRSFDTCSGAVSGVKCRDEEWKGDTGSGAEPGETGSDDVLNMVIPMVVPCDRMRIGRGKPVVVQNHVTPVVVE